jgi:hypothetical protein
MKPQPRHPLDNKFDQSSSGSFGRQYITQGIITGVDAAAGSAETGYLAKDVTYTVLVQLPSGGSFVADRIRPIDRYPEPFRIVPRAIGLPVVCYYNDGRLIVDFHERLFLEECPAEEE